MSYRRVGEINTEISCLEQERVKLLNEIEFKNDEAVKDLEWTKKCKAKFDVNPLWGSCLPAYTISVFGKVPHAAHPVCVMGNHALYQYNMMFSGHSFTSEYPHFYTSCKSMLFKFLKEVQFDDLDYDENTLEILKIVAEHSKNGIT